MRIGIDLMGSDRSHQELYEAVHTIASQIGKTDLKLLFLVFATPQALSTLNPPPNCKNIQFVEAPEVIEMDDEPLKAVRSKKASSLHTGLRLLRKKKLDAFITAGNTGALIAAASTLLQKMPGVRRPALLASLPSSKGFVSLIDAGGTVQLKAELLCQNALLGSQFHTLMHGIEAPKIGLLNVGSESKKGTLEHQEAFKKLSEHPNFVGNIEGREVFEGKVDVLVTDGFTGNVLLKTAEGVAALIFQTLREKSSSSTLRELDTLFKTFNWSHNPGAVLMGVKGLVIKCHGSSNAQALSSSIYGAIELIQNGLKFFRGI